MKHENGIDQAFNTFLNWYVETSNGPIPGDIQEAKYTVQGKRTHPLGLKRMIKLVEKYARNVFTINVSVELKKETGVFYVPYLIGFYF